MLKGATFHRILSKIAHVTKKVFWALIWALKNKSPLVWAILLQKQPLEDTQLTVTRWVNSLESLLWTTFVGPMSYEAISCNGLAILGNVGEPLKSILIFSSSFHFLEWKMVLLCRMRSILTPILIAIQMDVESRNVQL